MAKSTPNRERWDGWLGPRTWAPIAVILVVAVAVLGVLLAIKWDDANASNKATTTNAANALATGGRQSTHEHADFLVIIRGQAYDYGQDRFIAEKGNQKSDAAHVHDPDHTVVHIHKTGTTWDEFFRSVDTELTDPSYPTVKPGSACIKMPDGQKLCEGNGETMKFILNGVQIDGIANMNVHDMDRMLLSFGPETVDQVMQTQWTKVSDKACIVSERCASRIPPNQPQEICQGQGDCVKPGG